MLHCCWVTVHQLCPYLTYAILDDLVKKGKIQEDYHTAEQNYIKAVKKGLFKIMAKMGISTIEAIVVPRSSRASV